jgi:two-component system sensor histidine kinase RpfC
MLNLLQRLKERPDSEHVQPLLRALAGIAAAIYALITETTHGLEYGFGQSTQVAICLTGGLLTGGLGFFTHILRYPNKNTLRRMLGLIHDMVWCGLALYAFGDGGILIWGMYIWLVVGYGFRYGVTYLYSAAALALCSFFTVAYFSPFYGKNHELMALGTFLLAIVIPVYLGSLLKNLQRNLEAAREADRVKTRFLANVSHDLRTPLNVILANTEILARDLREHQQSLQPLYDMQEAGRSLGELVTNLLDIGRLEAGRLQLDSCPVNVPELLGRVRRLNEVAAREKGIRIYLTVSPDTPLVVNSDRLRLEQILNNIVSNAVKFTQHGYVHIMATPDIDSQSGDSVGLACSIRDTGIGMDRSAMDRIFSRFEQADKAYARRYEGAGLGLSIARELVKLMGGSITARSAKGEGSCFTVSLPLVHAAGTAAQIYHNRATQTVVVICSPERSGYWQPLRDTLGVVDVRVFVAKCAKSAMQAFLAEGRAPDVILVDAINLRDDLEVLPGLVAGRNAGSSSPCVLVTSPNDKPALDQYCAYRCVCSSDAIDTLRRALVIAAWTCSAEQSLSIDANQLGNFSGILKGRSVLVADDNELNRRVISNLLESAGSQVIESHNGYDALRKLNNHSLRIDVALLDVQMPDLTGIEVMRRSAAVSAADGIPMVALTADTTDECRSKCLNAGADSIIYKPVSMRSLYAELHRAITASDHTRVPQTDDGPVSHGQGTLDYSRLRELASSAQRPDYLAQLVGCFRNDGGDLLKQLRPALCTNDLGDFRALLHRLQGMSGNIGARAVAQLCQESLRSADAELRVHASRLTERLGRLHDEAASALDTFLWQSSQSTSATQALSAHPPPGYAVTRFPSSARCQGTS